MDVLDPVKTAMPPPAPAGIAGRPTEYVELYFNLHFGLGSVEYIFSSVNRSGLYVCTVCV